MNRTALTTGVLALSSLLAVSVPSPARGQNEGTPAVNPTQARGLAVDSSFQLSDVDAVNLFNGNLTMSIAIGPTYPAGGDLTYGLRLIYNSNVWNYWESCLTLPDPGTPVPPISGERPAFVAVPDPLANAGLGWSINPGRILLRNGVDVDQGRPQRPEETTYVGPDGSRHAFFPSVHRNREDDETSGGAAGGFQYTRDGSYLRLRSIPAGCEEDLDPAGPCRLELDFPSGMVHTFDQSAAITHNTVPIDWRVSRIEDPYGNFVAFDYGEAGGQPRWTITDGVGREHKITFATPVDGSGVTIREIGPRVTEVDLESIGGARAVYELDYELLGFERHRYESGGDSRFLCNDSLFLQGSDMSGSGIDPDVFRMVDLFVLTAVHLPSEAGVYRMSYYTHDELTATEAGGKAGTLEALRLPTGGGYGYLFSRYEHSIPVDPPGAVTPSRPMNYGVAEKTVYSSFSSITATDATGDVEGVWTYEQQKSQTASGELLEAPWDNALNYPFAVQQSDPAFFSLITPQQPCFVRTRVTDPLGNYTDNYFQTARVGLRREFGLPYAVCNPDTGGFLDEDGDGVTDDGDPLALIHPTTGSFVDPATGEPMESPDLWPTPGRQERYLSREVFSSDGELLRRVYVDYEFDDVPHPIPQRHEASLEPNARVRLTETEYWDDLDASGQPHQKSTRRLDFDHLGHYRTERFDASFGGQAKRWSEVAFNSQVAAGALPQGVSILPGEQDPWLLELFDYREVLQAPGTTMDLSASQVCHDPTTGAVVGQRIFAADHPPAVGALASGNDVLVRFDRDPATGEVTGERYFGGDDQDVSGVDGCEEPGLAPEYEIRHEYTAGVRSRSDFLDCAGGSELKTLDLTIDPSTGLATHSFDSAGFETRFEYDVLGRPTEICRPGVSVTVHGYEFAQLGGAESSVETEVYEPLGQCGLGTPVAFSESTFDGRGRKVRQSRRVPTTQSDAELVERRDEYNVMGWITAEGLWGTAAAATPPAATRYEGFDAFGRPSVVRLPDGTSTVEQEFRGDRWSRASVAVRTPAGDQESVRDVTRDGLGRIFMVEEYPDGPGSAPLKTTYRHDEGGRLAYVCVNDDDDVARSCTANGQRQPRTFDYDGRGKLVAESHPEIGGTLGGGTNTYRYDSRGNMLSKFAPAAAFDLAYRYDRAGRVTQVYLPDGQGGSALQQGDLLKELAYGRPSATPDPRSGRLVQAKRHNRVPRQAGDSMLRDVIVTETFAYDDPAGRLTGYGVRSSEGIHFATTIGGYDALDNVLAVTYPDCSRGECADLTAGTFPAHTVDFGYLQGRLASITEGPTAIADVRYHADGQLASVVRGNGVEDRWTLDPLGWRLGRIHTLGMAVPGDEFDTGTYLYDEAGNVTATGGDLFRYDRLNRLVFSDQGVAGGRAVETLAYDFAGNLTSIVHSGDVVVPAPGAIAVSSRTNRLEGGAEYDANGNAVRLVLGPSAFEYDYDPFNRMSHLTDGTVERSFLYTASDERFATLDLVLGDETYTPRGTGNQVLRRVRKIGGEWSWDRDYVHGTNQVAALTPNGIRHFHIDHLGTTRAVSDGQANLVESHKLYPFGAEIETAAPVGATEPLLFTGHERDPVTGVRETHLDYMHARYHSPYLGRFLSPDEVLGDPTSPGSWNRYSYARNSPLRLIDPDGREATESAVMKIARGLAEVGGVFAGILTVAPQAAPLSAGVLAAGATGLFAYDGTTKVDEGLTEVTGDPLALEKLFAVSMPSQTVLFLQIIRTHEAQIFSGPDPKAVAAENLAVLDSASGDFDSQINDLEQKLGRVIRASIGFEKNSEARAFADRAIRNISARLDRLATAKQAIERLREEIIRRLESDPSSE